MNGGGCPDRRFAIAAVVLATLVAAACSDPAEPTRAAPPPADTTTTTTTTEAPTTTEVPPTTVEDGEAPLFEPLYADPALDPEAQVEAAYHHHWDILLDAYRNGRTDYLHLVYTDEALTMRTEEIEQLLEEDQRVGGHVDHNYEITVHSGSEAVVYDGYRNFLGLVDPDTGAHLGEPGGSERLFEFRMRREDDQWRVNFVELHTFVESSSHS